MPYTPKGCEQELIHFMVASAYLHALHHQILHCFHTHNAKFLRIKGIWFLLKKFFVCVCISNPQLCSKVHFAHPALHTLFDIIIAED